MVIHDQHQCSCLPGNEDELADTLNFKTYYGKVVDGNNGRVLPFATIEAHGKQYCNRLQY